MLWPSVVRCYDEIVEDASILWLFPEKECTSFWELPVLGVLWLKLISEGLFAHIAFHDIWRKTGEEFMTNTGPRISSEATPMAILITDGVEGENLGMVTAFCHHDQIKMEASDGLSALCQHNAPEPSVVVVRWYTNTPYPYIPQGTSQLLYLNVSTLSPSLGKLSLPNSLWTTYVYEGYFHTLRLRCSYLMKREI